jgi:hypothetical protein
VKRWELQLRQLDHHARLWWKCCCAPDQWLPIVATKFYGVRWVSRQDRRDQVARGALPLRPRYADAPTVAEEAKRPLWLTDQDSTAGSTLPDQRDRPSGKGAEVALNGGAHRRESERYRRAMHHKMGIGKEGRQVLGIAERGPNCAAGERLGGADDALDRVRVVHRDVGTRSSGKCSSRLAGAPATEDDDVAPT